MYLLKLLLLIVVPMGWAPPDERQKLDLDEVLSALIRNVPEEEIVLVSLGFSAEQSDLEGLSKAHPNKKITLIFPKQAEELTSTDNVTVKVLDNIVADEINPIWYRNPEQAMQRLARLIRGSIPRSGNRQAILLDEDSIADRGRAILEELDRIQVEYYSPNPVPIGLKNSEVYRHLFRSENIEARFAGVADSSHFILLGESERALRQLGRVFGQVAGAETFGDVASSNWFISQLADIVKKVNCSGTKSTSKSASSSSGGDSHP